VVSYEFVAHSYSSLAFSATLSQSSFEPGAMAELSEQLTEVITAIVTQSLKWLNG
jgi:hypothetical protein